MNLYKYSVLTFAASATVCLPSGIESMGGGEISTGKKHIISKSHKIRKNCLCLRFGKKKLTNSRSHINMNRSIRWGYSLTFIIQLRARLVDNIPRGTERIAWVSWQSLWLQERVNISNEYLIFETRLGNFKCWILNSNHLTWRGHGVVLLLWSQKYLPLHRKISQFLLALPHWSVFLQLITWMLLQLSSRGRAQFELIET